MKLTIIVPIYNAERYLAKCLETIVMQTYRDLEIVLIDDGSLDDSLSICKRFQAGDDRIRVISQSNCGVVATRRRGIEWATGDYITFVDADDYLDLDAYQCIKDNMTDSNIDMVLYDLKVETESGQEILRNLCTEGVYSKNEMIQRIYPIMLSAKPFFTFGIRPTVFSKWFRREFLQRINISISNNVTLGEDVELTYQSLLQAGSVQVLHVSPYHYCKRIGTMTWEARNESDIITLEKDLKSAFQNENAYDLMSQQLEDYITFVRLLKIPYTIETIDHFFEDGENRIALYGAGGFGQALFSRYKEKIAIWVDKQDGIYARDKFPVESIERLKERKEDYDMVYIAILNEKLSETISKKLKEFGIECKIYYYKRGL